MNTIMSHHPSVTNYINTADPVQQEMMERLRALIHETVPGTTETIKWGRPIFGNRRDFAYFKTQKQYLTLGFFKRSLLQDPENLLLGTGKDMCHIKLYSPADIREDVLKAWFRDGNK